MTVHIQPLYGNKFAVGEHKAIACFVSLRIKVELRKNLFVFLLFMSTVAVMPSCQPLPGYFNVAGNQVPPSLLVCVGCIVDSKVGKAMLCAGQGADIIGESFEVPRLSRGGNEMEPGA